MAEDVRLGRVTTQIPARMDRLPWSRFHWMIVIGLGTVWILDGLEVTIVGSVAARLTEEGSGVAMTPAHIGYAAAIYVAGACSGALLFGQLTDRFGRKRLFIITLVVYVLATVATAFAFAPWYFFLCRFVTGMGIGGEYAAVNSAIDELIPARARGRVDIIINGSYWLGAALGALAAVFFLNTNFFAMDVGWRVAFGVGGVLGFVIMFVRRHVPESPRWMFIHGREGQAERLVDGIEREVREETRQELDEPGESITVRQRKTIPFREIAKVAFKLYPRRAVLGFALFVGQAFLYNAVTFDLGTILSTLFDVASGTVPYFFALFALGNFLGPLLLGRLFDTVGRKPMICGTFFISSALTMVLGLLLVGDGLNTWTFMAMIGVTFFFASAGASSAYLTVSEIFPMETRALAIAFFYAIGTAAGGITGPLLFGRLIDTGEGSLVAIGFFIGAVVMALGGVAELFFGVRAEKASLESIAQPLTVEEAEEEEKESEEPVPSEKARRQEARPERRRALEARHQAEEQRARAAEHRAAVHELKPRADEGDRGAAERLRVEEVLAQTAEWDAERLTEEAAAHDERVDAEDARTDAERRGALERAAAADERAASLRERMAALSAESRRDAESHAALAEAAAERARAREQQSMAAETRGRAGGLQGIEAQIARNQAETFDEWEKMHDELALAHVARAERDEDAAARHDREADVHRLRAESAADRMEAAQHRSAAESLAAQAGTAEQARRERDAAAERQREARERDERIRERVLRRERRERTGLRRLLPGPGRTFYSPGMMGTASRWSPDTGVVLDREINAISQALYEHGAISRAELADLVGARYWGPGRFRAALREAVHEGRAVPQARNRYAPPPRPTDANSD
ncbi:MFS transporter [Actinomadura sp. KC345]|uniref:MFS transporter n=1 Tax=Actinomadura sp. KC345 TaxID=2530371 RepID=UPI001FB61D79|nr:MFS transporter [Actinomadura sp. KC345]